ncbi:MAG: type III pantothenate kinase [Pygmaiobacter sp.]
MICVLNEQFKRKGGSIMLLTVNIGNFNILLAVYDGKRQLFRSQLRTDPMKTADEYAIQLKSVLSLYNVSPDELTGAIIACVAPALTSSLRDAIHLLRKVRVLTLGPGLKTGLNIKIDNPAQLGADIVASAAAVRAAYPAPNIVINFDTAITVMAIDCSGAVIGGCIAPGIKLSLEALTTHAAQLPQIDLEQTPLSVAGTNTVASMEAGLIIGNACMLDGLIDRFTALLGAVPTVIATGSYCRHITQHCTHAVLCEENLICDGLALLYRRNTKSV